MSESETQDQNEQAPEKPGGQKPGGSKPGGSDAPPPPPPRSSSLIGSLGEAPLPPQDDAPPPPPMEDAPPPPTLTVPVEKINGWTGTLKKPPIVLPTRPPGRLGGPGGGLGGLGGLSIKPRPPLPKEQAIETVAPTTKPPTEALKFATQRSTLESALGVPLTALDEPFKRGKLQKDVLKEADRLRKDSQDKLLLRLTEEAKAKIVKELTEGEPPVEQSEAEQRAAEQVRGMAGDLRLRASSETPKRAAFEDQAWEVVRKKPGSIRGPLEMMTAFDTDGGRNRVDAMLRDLLNENTLTEMSKSLAAKASEGGEEVTAEAMRKRLVAFGGTVLKTCNAHQGMFANAGLPKLPPHTDEPEPREVQDNRKLVETVTSLIDETTLSSITAMSQYGCLDADTFAESVNSPADANKYIVAKRMVEVEDRAEKHGDAVRAANNKASGSYKKDDLTRAATSVDEAGAGVCTTFGLAAAAKLLQAQEEGRLPMEDVGEGDERRSVPKIKRIEVVSGKAQDGSAHCYMVLNRNPETSLDRPEDWLRDGCVLVDPWAGTLGCKSFYLDARDYPAGLRKYITENVKSDYASG